MQRTKCGRDGLHFLTQKTTKGEMKNPLKEDLAVSKEQSALLKLALKRAHTARHSPQTQPFNNTLCQPGKEENRLRMILGTKIKLVEKCGQSLKSILTKADPWGERLSIEKNV